MDETYYINKCSSNNEIGKSYTKYGYSKTYSIEDKFVTLYYNQYANGADDYDDELVDVVIRGRTLLDNLQQAIDLKPMDLLGK